MIFDALPGWRERLRATRRPRASERLWAVMRDGSSFAEAQPAMLAAIQDGADVSTPVAAFARTSVVAPLEWALDHQLWTVATAMLDAGADPNALASEPFRWLQWDPASPLLMTPVPVHLPMAAQAVIAVASAMNNAGLDPSAWTLLERFNTQGAELAWTAHGSSLVQQMVHSFETMDGWSTAWLQRLNVTATDAYGRNALHWALGSRAVTTMTTLRTLLDAGVDPHQEDLDGQTALLLLVQRALNGHRQGDLLLKEVVESCPDILWEQPNRHGQSALMVLDEGPWPGLTGQVLDRMRSQVLEREKAILLSVLTDTPTNVPELSRGRSRL